MRRAVRVPGLTDTGVADGAHEPRRVGPVRSGVYLHLGHALRIMKAEPDYRKWGPLIGALPDDAREEVRAWLFVEAQKIRSFQRWLAKHGIDE